MDMMTFITKGQFFKITNGCSLPELDKALSHNDDLCIDQIIRKNAHSELAECSIGGMIFYRAVNDGSFTYYASRAIAIDEFDTRTAEMSGTPDAICFSVFASLWKNAQDQFENDFDGFIDECGGSCCLASAEKTIRMMQLIYNLAHSDIKAVRTASGMSKIEFANEYSIPIRTIENWESGSSKPVYWAHMMLSYAVVSDIIADTAF